MTDPAPGSSRDLSADMTAWATAHYGSHARVTRLDRLPGHSGISYLVTVEAGDVSDELVMRVPPVGVRRRANLDVVRFAPVLRLAEARGIPVPSVRWVSEDEEWFGTPYLMVSRVEGAPLADIFVPEQRYPARSVVDDIFREALSALAEIHQLDASELLSRGWAVPTSREEDVAQWVPLLVKSDVPEEIRRTEELGRRLLASAPPEVTPRVVHGDFYSNNWMVHENHVVALLDWENTTLNDPGWDLGWLATIYDPLCWGPSRAPWMDWHPQAPEFYAWYEAAAGRSLVRPGWYQALMCYRLASITPSKVRLHRTGRRVDPIWEVFAEAIPFQLERAFQLLEEES
jgi:aminoglycoside phosphotransferase (APT) family kinase protein